MRGAVLTHLLVPATTMLGLDDDPATLRTPHGDVPIPAALARELAHDPDQATWQRILIDPATGIATDISPTYRPPTRIATWCRVRDGYQTRFSTAAARRIELNHIHPYNHDNPAAGGPTTAANLASEGTRSPPPTATPWAPAPAPPSAPQESHPATRRTTLLNLGAVTKVLR